MNKVSIKAKLATGFGFLLVILAVTGFTSYYCARKMVRAAGVANAELAKKVLATAINSDIKQVSLAVHDYVLDERPEALSRNAQVQKTYEDHMDALSKILGTPENLKRLEVIRQSEAQYRAIANQEIVLRQAGKQKQAANLAFNDSTSAIKKVASVALKELEDSLDKRTQDAEDAQQAAELRSTTLISILVFVGLLLGLIIAIIIGRSISQGISRMVALIEEVAANNLAIEDMEITSEDEIGKAGKALNKMKNNLREIIRSIAGTALHVASASEEISSSASEQSRSAETQKDQAAQVATAMQEMSATVIQVSENSKAASDSSRRAADTARRGGAIVDDTLTKMRAIAESVSSTARKVEELGKSSDQIGRITGVIDDIADQTNLLALNAAIEAARAGEQGRGFAVVADEVRKLAERTSTATKEIAQMIKTIQDETRVAVAAMETGTRQVDEGVKTTSQAGDALKEIIQTSQEVGDMVMHIATAATQQSSATEAVNSNMDQIARLVKESAIGAQQSAKACEDLSGLAMDLEKMVGNFRLGDNGRGTGRPVRQAHDNPESVYAPALAEEAESAQAFHASAG